MHGNAYIVAVQVLLPQKVVSLTWWPIKSKVQQPLLSFTVTFDINHWCPGSAVWFYPHDSSDHSLTLLSNGPLHQFFTERALTGHKVVIARGSLKKTPQSGNTTGDLLNSVLQSMSDKTCKCAFFFFSSEREKIVLTLEALLFLLITGVRGPVNLIGQMADILILAVGFWLWCQPLQFSLQNRLWYVRAVCAIFTVFPSLSPVRPL